MHVGLVPSGFGEVLDLPGRRPGASAGAESFYSGFSAGFSAGFSIVTASATMLTS